MKCFNTDSAVLMFLLNTWNSRLIDWQAKRVYVFEGINLYIIKYIK